MRKDKEAQAEIARAIGVPQATVSKELRRDGCSNGHYSSKMARVFAGGAKRRSHKPRKPDADMRAFVVEKMERFQWSPEQIRYCDANGIEKVSVEWVYRLVRDDRESVGTLYRHCRHRQRRRERCVGAAWGTSPTRCTYTRGRNAWRAGRGSGASR